MYTIMFDSELPGTPEQVLGGFKDQKTTYARIFECLCRFVNEKEQCSKPTTLLNLLSSVLQLRRPSLCDDIRMGEGSRLSVGRPDHLHAHQPQLERSLHRRQLAVGRHPLGNSVSKHSKLP